MAGWCARSSNPDFSKLSVNKYVQIVQIVQTPTSFLPRDAGEDEGGGLSGAQRLNGWNVLNGL